MGAKGTNCEKFNVFALLILILIKHLDFSTFVFEKIKSTYLFIYNIFQEIHFMLPLIDFSWCLCYWGYSQDGAM